MAFFIFLFFFYSICGSNNEFKPSQLYNDGYGLPNHLTSECVRQINGGNLLGEEWIKRVDKKTQAPKEQIKEIRERTENLTVFPRMPSSSISQVSFNQININLSSSDEKDKKKKKDPDNNNAALIAAGIVGAVGVAAYVWDFMKFKAHNAQGCDYRLHSDGTVSNGVFYTTHQTSRFDATTVISIPDFCFQGQNVQASIPGFYSQGIIIKGDTVSVYGRDLSSIRACVSERFYVKLVNSSGKIQPESVSLPCKPKKIVIFGSNVFMVSADGYLYYATSDTGFARLYIKENECDLLEERIIDVFATDDYILAWTYSGHLMRIEGRDAQTGVAFFVRGSQIVTDIAMKDRSNYRIVSCLDGSYSLVHTKTFRALDQTYNFDAQNQVKRGVYKKESVKWYNRTFHELYRLVANRPFKVMGLFFMGVSLLLYLKHLKKI